MISDFLSSVFGVLGIELFFALCALVVFAAFIVCLFLSVFKNGYGLQKRAWYLIILALFCALLKARANILAEIDFAPLLFVIGLLLFLPVFFIRVKLETDNKEDLSRREFVRFLDSKIKNGGDSVGFHETNFAAPPADETLEVLKAENKTEEMSAELDFSHVKNVLQRLETATLSYTDRKQIHDLELTLYMAEKGDYSKEIKSKINEGLGNLLKIMAKHGV